MGRGSNKAKKGEKETTRQYYTFTLNSENAKDKELIEFLSDRSTTASVKEALHLLKDNKSNQISNPNNNQDLLQQILALLLNNNNTSQVLQQLQQGNKEQSATTEQTSQPKGQAPITPEPKKEVKPINKEKVNRRLAKTNIDNVI